MNFCPCVGADCAASVAAALAANPTIVYPALVIVGATALDSQLVPLLYT